MIELRRALVPEGRLSRRPLILLHPDEGTLRALPASAVSDRGMLTIQISKDRGYDGELLRTLEEKGTYIDASCRNRDRAANRRK